MTKLHAALRQKFPTPQAAMEALGLDAALLDDTEEDRMKLTNPAREAIRSALTGKLAMDANIEEIMPLIEAIAGLNNGNGNGGATELTDATPMATEPNSAVPMEDNWDEEETEEEKNAADMRRAVRAADARRRLGRDETEEEKDKREGEDSAADARERLGRDETPEESEKREAKDRARRAARDQRRGELEHISGKDQVVTKKALDAAMATARRLGAADAIRREREIHTALREVRPYVGDLAMDHDSADEVRRTALKMLGVKTEGVHPSAFSTILAMQPLAGARQPVVAMDSAGAKGFAERFPDALRVNVI
jgi:hypothetical protein